MPAAASQPFEGRDWNQVVTRFSHKEVVDKILSGLVMGIELWLKSADACVMLAKLVLLETLIVAIVVFLILPKIKYIGILVLEKGRGISVRSRVIAVLLIGSVIIIGLTYGDSLPEKIG